MNDSLVGLEVEEFFQVQRLATRKLERKGRRQKNRFLDINEGEMGFFGLLVPE